MELNKLRKIIEQRRTASLELDRMLGDLMRTIEKMDDTKGKFDETAYDSQVKKCKNDIIAKAGADHALMQVVIELIS